MIPWGHMTYSAKMDGKRWRNFNAMYTRHHDDILYWIRFPLHWLFVRGMKWPPGLLRRNKPAMRSFGVSFSKLLKKETSNCRWFEAPRSSRDYTIIWQGRHLSIMTFQITRISAAYWKRLKTNNKENDNVPRHLWVDFTGHWWIPSQKE